MLGMVLVNLGLDIPEVSIFEVGILVLGTLGLDTLGLDTLVLDFLGSDTQVPLHPPICPPRP